MYDWERNVGGRKRRKKKASCRWFDPVQVTLADTDEIDTVEISVSLLHLYFIPKRKHLDRINYNQR